MSSEGYFAQYDTGEIVYVEGEGFPEGQEFYPQGIWTVAGKVATSSADDIAKAAVKAGTSKTSSLVQTGLLATAKSAAVKLYKVVYKASDNLVARLAAAKTAPTLAARKLVSSVDDIALQQSKLIDDNLKAALRLADDNAKLALLKKAATKADDLALKTSGKTITKADDTLKILLEKGVGAADDPFKKIAGSADDTAGAVFKKGIAVKPFQTVAGSTDDAAAAALKKVIGAADDPFKKIAGSADDTAGAVFKKGIAVKPFQTVAGSTDDAAAAALKKVIGAADEPIEAIVKPGLLSKLGATSLSTKLIVAGGLITGGAASVGVVSALMSKPTEAGVGASSPEKIADMRNAYCGAIDWSKTDYPTTGLAACKSCIVTGNETEDGVVSCIKIKLAPAIPVPGDQKGDIWISGIGPSGHYPGDTGTYSDGGTGSKTAQMCSHPDNTADQKQMCLDCVILADGATYYDRVAQIKACIAEKRKTEPTSTDTIAAVKLKICGSLTDAAKYFPENPSVGLEACKSCVVTGNETMDEVTACFNAKVGGKSITEDICENPGLAAAIKASCKACQPLVANPQDATQLRACMDGKPPVGGDICDSPGLTDEIRMFCKACQPLVANPQDETQLAACVAEKRVTPPGPPQIYRDTNDPCDTNSRVFNPAACGSGGGTVYTGVPVSQDTNDPCDTNSQMFDAAACGSAGGETYTTIQEEISPVVPLVILGGSAALIFLGMRKS